MRGDVPGVVPSVIVEPDAAVSVAAANGGFVERVEVFNPSVLLAVQADKIREQFALGQFWLSFVSSDIEFHFSISEKSGDGSVRHA